VILISFTFSHWANKLRFLIEQGTSPSSKAKLKILLYSNVFVFPHFSPFVYIVYTYRGPSAF
jgi:hypothetical protein